MKLSAPIYQLKRQAHDLKKKRSITLAQALDEIARREGFGAWSLLQAKKHLLLPQSYDDVLSYCNPGDLVLVGGRPQHGKTSFTIGLMMRAIEERKVPCSYFSLSFVEQEVREKMQAYNPALVERSALYNLDCSDEISADYILAQTQPVVKEGSVIVIDYLQLLDQKRTTPPLQHQVEQLRAYAATKRCTIFCISQINRSVEDRSQRRPGVGDIHLPNPLDITLFHKLFFLYRERPDSPHIEVQLAGKQPHRFVATWKDNRFA